MSSNTKYFIFSQQQQADRIALEKTLGKTPTFGTVIVNGLPKVYTELVSSMPSRYSDAVVITSGDPTTISYTLPKY